jgi:hypothetical protein
MPMTSSLMDFRRASNTGIPSDKNNFIIAWDCYKKYAENKSQTLINNILSFI